MFTSDPCLATQCNIVTPRAQAHIFNVNSCKNLLLLFACSLYPCRELFQEKCTFYTIGMLCKLLPRRRSRNTRFWQSSETDGEKTYPPWHTINVRFYKMMVVTWILIDVSMTRTDIGLGLRGKETGSCLCRERAPGALDTCVHGAESWAPSRLGQTNGATGYRVLGPSSALTPDQGCKSGSVVCSVSRVPSQVSAGPRDGARHLALVWAGVMCWALCCAFLLMYYLPLPFFMMSFLYKFLLLEKLSSIEGIPS